jgi:hypothetical protein
MHRPTILLMLALSGLLAACGKENRPTTSRPTASSQSAKQAPSLSGGAVSKPRALAFARAVNLTAADIPGFTVTQARESKTPREQQAEREMLRCTGSAGSGEGLASVSSKHFQLKRNVVDLGVSSQVAVAQSPAVAAGELLAIRSSRIRGCFSRYLDEVFQGQSFGGAVARPVSIQAGTPPAPGTTGSFGWRVTATLSVRRVNVSFYMDILGFVYGPTRVTLFSSGALLPFPAAIQQRLFLLLLDRAKAFRL